MRLFKLNVLAAIPAGATVLERGGRKHARWTDGSGKAQERPLNKAGNKIIAGLSDLWYGKVKTPKGWQRVKLYRDKGASEAGLRTHQGIEDRRSAGVSTVDIERLALPMVDLAKQYIDAMRARKLDADHIRISEWMLNRLVDLAGWKRFGDITVASMHKALATLDGQGKTASYQNKFVKRAKAFVHWLLPDGHGDPLDKLHRVREKGAKRTRERRAATDAELRALFALELPDDRRLAYALAAYNGLRRNEIKRDEDHRLRWSQLHTAATIPFITLYQKQAKDDATDAVPLHPYVARLLAVRPHGMPRTPLCGVPDVATLEKDWTRAGVVFKDEQGRRLDFHALRHTFETLLDRTGASRATKKKLMRHAAEDVTDGYAHAELAEMLTALEKITAPDVPQVQTAQATGTGDMDAVSHDCRPLDHLLTMTSARRRIRVRGTAQTAVTVGATRNSGKPLENQGFCATSHDNARGCLPSDGTRDIMLKTGPSTQVD